MKLKKCLESDKDLCFFNASEKDVTARPEMLFGKEEKIKMLTPDGKLVEVNKSVMEKNAGVRKATDKEVFDWMDPKHKA